VFDQLGQAPRGERAPGLLWWGASDPADQLEDVGTDSEKALPPESRSGRAGSRARGEDQRSGDQRSPGQ
jgi:hypothetical protein